MHTYNYKNDVYAFCIEFRTELRTELYILHLSYILFTCIDNSVFITEPNWFKFDAGEISIGKAITIYSSASALRLCTNYIVIYSSAIFVYNS